MLVLGKYRKLLLAGHLHEQLVVFAGDDKKRAGCPAETGIVNPDVAIRHGPVDRDGLARSPLGSATLHGLARLFGSGGFGLLRLRLADSSRLITPATLV